MFVAGTSASMHPHFTHYICR